MSGNSNIFKVDSSVKLEILSTPLEGALEEVLEEEGRSLNPGAIEHSIKHDYNKKEYIFLRRVTRSNKLGHNLIYLRWLGLHSVNLNKLIKTGLDEFGHNEEFICLSRSKPREYFTSIEFDMKPEGYKIIFGDTLVRNGFEVNGWQECAIDTARQLDANIGRSRCGFIVADVSNGVPLRKIVKELCHSYLNGDYKIYKEV